MTSQKTALPVLTSTSSTEEEIRWLDAVTDLIPEGSYLSSLLSVELLSTFAKSAHDDIGFNPMELITMLRMTVQEQQQILSSQEEGLAAAQELYSREIASLKVEHEIELKALITRTEEEVRDLHDQVEDAMHTRQALYEAQTEQASLSDRLEYAQEQILKLKAMIFDLQHPDLA